MRLHSGNSLQGMEKGSRGGKWVRGCEMSAGRGWGAEKKGGEGEREQVRALRGGSRDRGWGGGVGGSGGLGWFRGLGWQGEGLRGLGYQDEGLRGIGVSG